MHGGPMYGGPMMMPGMGMGMGMGLGMHGHFMSPMSGMPMFGSQSFGVSTISKYYETACCKLTLAMRYAGVGPMIVFVVDCAHGYA